KTELTTTNMLKNVKRMACIASASALMWMASGGASLYAQAAAAPAATPEAAAAPAATPAGPDSVAYPPGANAGTAIDLQWPIPADSTSVNPDGKGKVTNDELIQNVAHNKVSINLVWT